MGLTPAERQKRYKERLKQNPDKYEEYKKKKRENYHKKKRLVKDLSPKEKYNARLIWRLRKKNLKQKKQNLNRVLEITPPSSPSIIQVNLDGNVNENLEEVPQRIEVDKKASGRKKVRRDRSKLYRENVKLKEEIQKLKRQNEKYKKRCQRKESKEKEPEIEEETKYQKLSTAMKSNYGRMKKLKEKRILKNIISQIEGPEKQEIIKESLGITSKLRTSIKIKVSATKLKKKIEDFFMRDDISRASAGKKETCTINGQKIQKRFLLDSMKFLFKTFKQENPNMKCSYYYFTKNRPRHIVKPSVSGREMCLCKTHTNPKYKANALKNKGVIDTSDINALIAKTVCNTKSQNCMYGTCNLCRDLKIKPIAGKDTGNIIWKEWTRVEELYEKDRKEIKTFKNIKKEKQGSVKDLIQEFNQELKVLKKHVYNMKVQFHNFRQAIDNLQETEVVIVVDSSENYSCKLHEEIQSHQFGGSRQQVSLHTVVAYLNTGNDKKKVESYCTCSSNTNHQPAAIWAHLDPILKDIKSRYPQITTVHFFSDGPFSQYRQKQNFYLGSTTLFDYGFTAMTWSFFEAGHGKGPADGIGGYLKRSADDLVARGDDISCAKDFYDALKDVSKISLFLISSDDISQVSKLLPPKIPTLVGTKSVHQIYTNVRGELKYRILSCFCNRGFCDCFSPKIYKPVMPAITVESRIENDRHDCMAVGEAEVEPVMPAVTAELRVEDDRHNFMSVGEAGVEEICQVGKSPTQSRDSDDDIPLSTYGNPKNAPLQDINLSDLCQPRQKNWYNIIYQSPEESENEDVNDSQKPCSSKLLSDKENQPVQCGDFLLVKVAATKGKIFKYACVVNDLHDDGELRVTFLRSVKNKKIYRLEKNDISDIDYTDIVEILPEPEVKIKRGQKYYEFPVDIAVYEK